MQGLHTDQMLLWGGVSFIKVWLTMILVHSGVTMAKLEILIAVAVFLNTVSGTTVSATQNYSPTDLLQIKY